MEMRRIFSVLIFVGLFGFCGLAQNTPIAAPGSKKIVFSELGTSGITILDHFSDTLDAAGEFDSYELVIGKFTRGCFFSDYYGQTKGNWSAGGNQFAPHILKSDFENILDDKWVHRGVFLVLEMPGGDYLAILPVSGTKTISWIEAADKNAMKLHFGTLGNQPVSGEVPLIAWSKSDDVYTACRKVWELAIHSKPVVGRTDWRYKKTYPTPFKYLGWCSWEEFKREISSKLLIDVTEKIKVSAIPVRHILVDDGHQKDGEAEGQRLKSFEPDGKKFPDGWKPFLDVRKEGKIKWIGIWHAFAGLQNTLHPDNDFGQLNEHLMQVTPVRSNKTGILPKDNIKSARAFYDALIGSVRGYGFDYTKIDFQNRELWWYSGTGNPVEASLISQQAMERAAHRDLNGLINCMAHNQVCIFNTRYSAVTRTSMDYKVGDAPKGRHHLWQSFNNTPLFGQTVWGDHDMFHSSDPYSGRMMAVSKAMSGGPVYLSDNPDRFVKAYIEPLCYQDGELLRPVAPGGPLPESMFVQPMEELLPYRVIAPFQDGSAAIVVYNLYNNGKFDYWAKPVVTPENGITIKSDVNTVDETLGWVKPEGIEKNETVIKGFFSPDDYTHAGDMIQPYTGKWQLPAGGLVAWDWYGKRGFKLEKRVEFDLKGFSDKLFIISPVKDDWAIIGRSDKYLSCAVNNDVRIIKNQLIATLNESGPVIVWSGKGIPKSEEFTLTDLGDGFYEVKMAIGEKNKRLLLSR